MSYAATGTPATTFRTGIHAPPPSAWVSTGTSRLMGVFCSGVAILVVMAVFGFTATTPVLVLTGGIIAALSVLPCYLWCRGRTHGPPLLAMYSLFFIPAFAMPLWSNHPALARYDEAEQVRAGLTVCVFLAVVMAACLPWMRRQPRLRPNYRIFEGSSINFAALFLMLIGAAYAVLARWDKIPDLDIYYSAVRSLCTGLGMLGTFLTGYRIGQGQMRGFQKLAAYLLLAVLFIVAVSGMVLINAMGYLMTGALGKWLARGKLPLILLISLAAALSFFHLGKAEMRLKHWGKRWTPLAPQNYPDYFREWIGFSAANLSARLRGEPTSHKTSTLAERAGNIHMLMLVQRKTPDDRDYLWGKTYEIIPELLVPRFVNPSKPRTHEGTYMLCIYYGLQSRNATKDTTIAFDLISEAYANFGYPGVLAMAVLVGTLLGWLTWMTAARPGLSVWLCVSLLVVVGLNLSAASAGVCVTSVLQGTAVLMLVALLFSSSARTAVPTT